MQTYYAKSFITVHNTLPCKILIKENGPNLEIIKPFSFLQNANISVLEAQGDFMICLR